MRGIVMSMDESEFDAWVRDLEERMQEEVERAYSKKVIGEWTRPANVGRMARPDAHARLTGTCGDTMEVFLAVDGDTIARATFLTDGCGATVACGSMLTKLVTGCDTATARRLTPQHLCNALDGLPEENRHCASLAVQTLRMALDDLEHRRGGR
jgi:nitrogen fixation NifU-like protein